jgi:radical SAM superfamily enzyme YgiQ (UPF0313 family)
MKVLFIYPNLMHQENISLGIACLSAYLKKYGHETALVDYTWGGTIDTTLKKMDDFKPRIVAFSMRSGEFNFSLKVAEKIKEKYGNDIKIIFGGVHPTVAPKDVVKHVCVDYVCIGEGEKPLLELCDMLEEGGDTSTIRGIWTKRGETIIENEIADPIEDLDTLPFPDREIFDVKRYVDSRSGGIDIMSSRGCCFDCSYCINNYRNKLYKNIARVVRKRSVKNVIEEIKQLKAKYGVTHLLFQDDLFTASLPWIKEFSENLPKSLELTYKCNTRSEMITRDLCRYLKDSGCISVFIGIESGSERIAKEVMNRNTTNEQIESAFKMCKDAGLPTYSFNMIGLPYETTKEIAETILLNKKVQPEFLQVSIFQPFPGTKLHKLCVEEGWFDPKVLPYSHQFFSFLKYPQISSARIYWEKVTFRYRVLKDTDLKKALITLIYDCFFVHLTKVRHFIPQSLKTGANKTLNSFQSK